MASKKTQLTQVGKRKVELSNLDKIYFPEDEITKAQVIEYYYNMAPTILAHAKGRPLSVVRYPDGIAGESFFQKNRPDWAPSWIEGVVLGEEKANYIVAAEDATLVWLANLACLELHQMHCRAPHFDKPDYIAYDFDPPPESAFSDVVRLALEFKEYVEGLGYHAFVKTTGRKGLHILTPIEARWDFPKVFDAARAVAEPFVNTRNSAMTLQIKKENRKGRVLLDIYRNRMSQTIVTAYSLRGSVGAPVSIPLAWEELDSLKDPRIFNIQSVPPRVRSKGDPWESMAAYATPLHTEKKVSAPVQKNLAPARTRKTPAQLVHYSHKRSFDTTSEPAPSAVAVGKGYAFVVHRHHASRLHYDLRLEQKGVLKSWAVPKGLPPRPGIRRLAISVEDHPLEYANFEGAIPKSEYGGGMMWKFATGRHEISKQKSDGFYFRLHSPELNGEYRMHNTKENQWLLEKVDPPQVDWLTQRIEPMLAKPADRVPNSTDYQFELKWDGIRALISLDEGRIRINGRNGLDLTSQFPELLASEKAFRATCGVFDGEIVCLEPDGKPNFRDVIYRMQQNGENTIALAKAKHPAVCYLFDCLYLDGRSIINEPLTRRREWLQDLIRKDSAYRMSDAVEDGVAFYGAVRQMGLEGIMAKRRDSPYLPGKRNESWLKLKAQNTAECLIIGFTEGKGDRQSTFGALYLAQETDGVLTYVGKAGSGFDESSLAAVRGELDGLTRTKRSVNNIPSANARSVWVEPKLLCEVRYASRTPDGLLREPVFLRLRPDLVVK